MATRVIIVEFRDDTKVDVRRVVDNIVNELITGALPKTRSDEGNLPNALNILISVNQLELAPAHVMMPVCDHNYYWIHKFLDTYECSRCGAVREFETT